MSSWPSGTPQGRLKRRNPVEQVEHESDGRVVEAEPGAQPLEPGDHGELPAGEPQPAGGVSGRVEDAEGYEPADHFRVQPGGRGMPNPGGKPGDLFAEAKIMVPPRPSKAERELFEQLAAASDFDPRRRQ